MSIGHFGPFPITDEFGNTLPGAQFTVYESDGETLATLWSDETGTLEADNPGIVDALGNMDFFAEQGAYVVSFSGHGGDTTEFDVEVIQHPDNANEVTGSRANTEQALASLLTALEDAGIIIDSTTA